MFKSLSWCFLWVWKTCYKQTQGKGRERVAGLWYHHITVNRAESHRMISHPGMQRQMWLMKLGIRTNAFCLIKEIIKKIMILYNWIPVVVGFRGYLRMEDVEDWACFLQHSSSRHLVSIICYDVCTIANTGADHQLLERITSSFIQQALTMSFSVKNRQMPLLLIPDTPIFSPNVHQMTDTPVYSPNVHQRMGTGAGDRHREPEWDELSAVTEPEAEGGRLWRLWSTLQ